MFSKPIRVSPAMGVALVALAFAVGGTSLAQGAATRIGRLISGSSIKKGSIPGNRLIKGGVAGDRIRANTLTGKQINENSLAMVPSAKIAGTATKAQTAATSTNAQRATNADNALALGGTAAASYLTFATRPIPSGLTVTGAFGLSSNVTTLGGTPPTNDLREVVQLPGLAPSDLTDATVNFGITTAAVDADPTCTGTPMRRPRPPARSASTSRARRASTRRSTDRRFRGSSVAARGSSCTRPTSTAAPACSAPGRTPRRELRSRRLLHR